MSIFLNQIGYLPDAYKAATITHHADRFAITELPGGKTVYEGKITGGKPDEASGDIAYIAEFTNLRRPGTYVLRAGGSASTRFRVRDGLYADALNTMLKCLYYQRCGCGLSIKCAGEYAHAPCHTEKAKLLWDHDASVDVTGGWHDAGDYGRYITPAAVTVSTLLSAWELFPAAFRQSLNLPESGNGVPDILNECRYELEWMLKMQLPDGGVAHKVTTYTHAPFVMPEEDRGQLYVFPVSTMATGAFAGALAQAARAFASYDPAFSDRLRAAAERAWDYLCAHPAIIPFHNPEGCNTGEYGDACDGDERYWAAAELYRLTGKKEYHEAFLSLALQDFPKCDFGWANNGGFGTLCYLFTNAPTDGKTKEALRRSLLFAADERVRAAEASGYGVSLNKNEYVWGSNMLACVNGMLFVIALLLTDNEKYGRAALMQIDYLFGRNALGISYVSGFGERAMEHPHNRPTECDTVELPMPGWVAGGPCGARLDPTVKQLIMEDTPPMKCYIDTWSSYSTNEIAIYWNSAAAFLLAYFI